MIPLKLTLKNFLSYRDNVPTLDLEGIHVACLCGQNGHGKSALLDSMTWALWGKARGKNQSELIHYGYDEMLVDLEFLARDVHYRVVRRHSSSDGRRRQGASDLQLQVQAGDGFQPITGNSVRETQAKIDQLTGMDYDTFINSAFLLQGRADEFTSKPPGERKEVLARILALGLYDELQERAKERAGVKKARASSMEDELVAMREEISRRDDYTGDLDQVSRHLADVSERLESSKQELDALKLRAEDLRRKRDELEELGRRLPVLQGHISNFSQEIESAQGRIEAYQSLMQDKVAIEGGLAKLLQCRLRYEELSSSRDRFDELMKGKADLERHIDSARGGLEERIKELDRRMRVELRPKVNASSALSEKLEDESARLQKLGDDEQAIEQRRQRLQELAVDAGQIESLLQQLKSEGQELRYKLNLVKDTPKGALCPLCGTELGAQGAERLSQSCREQIEEKLRLYRESEGGLKVAEEEKLHLDRELPALDATLRRSQQDTQSAIASLDLQLKEAQAAEVELEHLTSDLADERRILEQGAFATQEHEQVRKLENQIAALGYDQTTYKHLNDEMKGLQPFEDRHRQLQDAMANLPHEQESLTRSQDMYQHLQGELEASGAKKREMEDQISELPHWEERLSQAEAAYHEHESVQQDLLRRQGELEGALKKVEALDREIGIKESDLNALREEQGIYQELAQAFGKRGVQAMLIETVLPRVEEEANVLLGRMTDNRMHVNLETQRGRRSGKGEPIETLDIKISDEMGPRSYELFSGGEAFRINLALRIALSKVLAHRRGAPLPTLFIDEGFGTQDTAGREKILDVVNAIEGDFQKIIVITHLDDIKEAFPARIEVQKEESGSTFWIS